MPQFSDHGGKIFATARSLGITPEELTDFSASINPLGFSPLIRDELLRTLDGLVHYPDSDYNQLRQELAVYHHLPSECVTVANGSTEIIYKLPYLLQGKRAVIVAPAFSEYARALEQCGWVVEYFELDPEKDFSIDWDTLAAVLAAGVDALYFCNPANPTGMLYSRDDMEKLCRLCAATGTFLVLDEAFMDFCEEYSAVRIAAVTDNVVILRSMTKFFGIPGLRLGYSISSGAFAERLKTQGGPWSVNTLALSAGVVSLRDSRFISETREVVRFERQALYDGLLQIPRLKPYHSSTNFLLVEILGGMTAAELAGQLQRQWLLIRDCANFRGLTPAFFRVAVKTGEENSRLLGCLKTILS
ncbi:MAG TPA: threonine-phosphate decarboxylase [Desulfuromonadales bacterium]|nr:threonine-phosphate decarboxylase [Desulfuromonadales bacterium]